VIDPFISGDYIQDKKIYISFYQLMIFSKAWGYAVRALLYLAEHKEQGPVLSSVIAEEESIPGPFLVKILGTLAGAGIVESTRGRGGGFILRADPENIALYDISVLLENPAGSGNCILGYGDCIGDDSCPIHEHWVEPRKQIDNFLANTTLADLRYTLPSVERKRLEERTGDQSKWDRE
jgi:Rrf2 family protein